MTTRNTPHLYACLVDKCAQGCPHEIEQLGNSFHSGRRAHQVRILFKDCPFYPGSAMAAAWKAGWRSAAKAED